MDKKELTFQCAICGTWHNNILDRAQCEIACTEKKAEEERKAAEAKKAAEYEARVKEVNMAFEKAYELRDKLVADYGEYKYQRKFNNIDECKNLDDVLNFIFGV